MGYRLPQFHHNSVIRRLVLSAGIVASYIVLFLLLHDTLGEDISVISLIPAGVIAWFFGPVGAGIASTGLSITTFFLIYSLSNSIDWGTHLPGAVIGTMVLAGVGTMMCWARKVYDRKRERKLLGRAGEEKIQEDIQKDQRLFEDTNQGIALGQLVFDQNGKVTDWVIKNVNPAFEKILGTPCQQIIGTRGSKLHPRFDDLLQQVNRFLQDQKNETSDPALSSFDLPDCDLKMQLSLLDPGQIAFWITDVNEERKAIESERRQRQLAEALRDINAALTSTLELDDVLDRIIIHIQKVTSFDAINIMLIDHGRVRAVRHQGYQERGLEGYIEGFDKRVVDVPGMQWMYTHRKPLVFSDTRQTDSWLIFPPTAWIRSFAGIPISRRGEIIGFINLNSGTPGFFQPEFIDQLLPFADQAALAIENARAYQNIQNTARRMAVLNQASSMLNKPVEFQTVIQVTTDCFLDALEIDLVSLALFDSSHKRLMLTASRSLDGDQLTTGVELLLSEHPAEAYVVENNRPLLVQNGFTEPDTMATRAFMQSSGIMAVLVLPLIVGDEMIGLVSCYERKTKRFYTPDEVDLANSIANLAAVRIEQARIYEEERKQVFSLAQLHATSLDISMSNTNPDLLKTIVKRATWLLNSNGGTLYLSVPQKRQLLCKVSHNLEYNEEGTVVEYGEGAAGIVAETRKYLIVDDYANWEYCALDMEAVGDSFGLLTVPVMLQGEVTGVIQVSRTDLSHHYSTQDAELLSLFSSQVAVSLENARLYEEIQQVAIRDSLTGVYNRRGLFEVAEREIARAQRYQRPFSVCLIDIDHFKRVNDTYGHLVGDEVLLKLAQRLNQNLRSIDLLGRFGGEEFIILAVENDLDAARLLAERLCRMIAARPIYTSKGKISITLSIGVAELSDNIRDLPSLIQAADQALYFAKNSGRNQVQHFVGSLTGVLAEESR